MEKGNTRDAIHSRRSLPLVSQQSRILDDFLLFAYYQTQGGLRIDRIQALATQLTTPFQTLYPQRYPSSSLRFLQQCHRLVFSPTPSTLIPHRSSYQFLHFSCPCKSSIRLLCQHCLQSFSWCLSRCSERQHLLAGCRSSAFPLPCSHSSIPHGRDEVPVSFRR